MTTTNHTSPSSAPTTDDFGQFPTRAEASAQPRCEYCDGTGDVHGIDGEWRGECTACKPNVASPSDYPGLAAASEKPIGEGAANGAMENCDARIRRWRDAFDAMQRRAMKAEARMDDLAMLVKKLVRHVRKSSPDNNMAAMAMDYLEREGLAGSPLRDAANGVMGEREASAYEALLQALGYPWLPCPICKGTEGCDHSVPERARAALTAEKVAAEPLTWREAIKSYTSPDMTLAPQPVETQVAAVGYVNSEWAKYRRGTTTIYPEARPLIATSPLYDHAQPAQTQVAQAEPVGYMMKRKTGTDTGFSWHHDDPLFSADWERIPLYTAAQPAQTERALTGAQKAAISYAIGSIKAVPGWNDGIVETLNALLAAHPESGGKS